MATPKTTVQVVMPAMGESVTEGTVLTWLKQVGDSVAVDEPLVEISTDKVDAEVPSPAAGVLLSIAVEPDQTVQVGQVLAEIETADDSRPTTDDSGEGSNGSGGSPPSPPASVEPVDVTFPEMGDSVAEGTILERDFLSKYVLFKGT